MGVVGACDFAAESEGDAEGLADLGDAVGHGCDFFGAGGAEFGFDGCGFVDAFFGGGVLVEVVGSPGDGEEVIFASRVGSLV